MRKVNRLGKDLIKEFEGCELEAYPDPASPLAVEMRKPLATRKTGWKELSGHPWTCGFGATGLDLNKKPPSPIGPHTKWTQAQADFQFQCQVDEFAKQVFPLIKKEITDNQFAALVSFAYNCGIGNLKSSTLLKMVNLGKFKEAADQFPLWNKAGGVVMGGLTRRRDAERRLFLTP